PSTSTIFWAAESTSSPDGPWNTTSRRPSAITSCQYLNRSMPLSAREVQALEDMLRFGTDAIGYVQGMDFNTFVADHRTHQATMYAIATVAEASHRITPE